MFKRQPVESADEKQAFEYAKLAVSETGAWIKNADTKATILAAGLGATATVTASRAAPTWALIAGSNQVLSIAAVIAVSVFVVGAVGTVWCAVRTLIPRTNVSGGRNPFAWPSVASSFVVDDSEFQKASAKQAWNQVHALALIAKAKYEAFALALRWFILTVIGAGVLVALASTVPPN
ncbi:hypothetical protein EDF31_101616 [Curtobacterium sp. PhB142]|uniref:hypothetical protein n=1 Tax=unclassified Curtobacterium TaxID=257496 RepID=UPI000DA7C235|nr:MULTISPECIES: hypothetical protein [unclassified Curtobacterium]PZE86603.1 hypothetical protein DEJ00_17575 [Curtobacterium sp. MCLR17_039]TCL88769.1 hypothetical protein EDF31_101616 [Curtobacterium sp. PhB142]TCM03868.1 hypothetical protein EDF26_10278 [Curtobacterium sp. PhB134]WIE57962.1 hypothetical protein DEI96_017690 [Curtobacterium sp. MCLR17_031]